MGVGAADECVVSWSWTFSQQRTRALMISSCHGDVDVDIRGQQVARVVWRALIAERRVVGERGANGSVIVADSMGIMSCWFIVLSVCVVLYCIPAGCGSLLEEGIVSGLNLEEGGMACVLFVVQSVACLP